MRIDDLLAIDVVVCVWVMWVCGGEGGSARGEDVWGAGDVEAHGYLLDGGAGVRSVVETVDGRGGGALLDWGRVHSTFLYTCNMMRE